MNWRLIGYIILVWAMVDALGLFFYMRNAVRREKRRADRILAQREWFIAQTKVRLAKRARAHA